MWEILVVHVGRIADDGFKRGIERYASMVGGGWRIRTEAVPGSRRKDIAALRQEETRALLRRVPKESIAIAVDQAGEGMDSPAFARLLASYKDRGRRVAFLVGGAHGLDRKELGETRTLSLSDMTYPHELATLMLMEQIYRANASCAGKAYAK
jgi:23S rRNA (pseudouridine1915-N3)-methyltransferase